VDDETPDDNSPQPSRRTFLTGAAGLTGVALAVGAWKPVFAMEDAPISAAASSRQFAAGHIALTLNETAAGFLSFADGGNAFSDVVNEKLGQDNVVRKHIGGVKYEDITITATTGMSKAFYDWISSSLTSKASKMSGAIDATDFNFKIRSEMSFFNALITEVGFPALDAASKDAAKMTIKFAPESTRISNTPGGTLKSATNQKVTKWLSSNFKLTLDGVDTSHVTHIDAFALTFDVSLNSDGNPVGRNLNVPNMKVRVPVAGAQDFIKWHQDFVIDGNSGQEQEKTGSISYLAPGLTTEIFRLDIGNIGIFALDYDPLVEGTDSVRQVTVQLYAETMKFFNVKGSIA